MSIDTSKFKNKQADKSIEEYKRALEKFKDDRKGLDQEEQRRKLEQFRKRFGLEVPPDMKFRLPTLKEYLKRLEKKKKLEDRGIGKSMEAGMKVYAKGGGVRKVNY
jgi:NADPH-dependent curcumin reductase CurA